MTWTTIDGKDVIVLYALKGQAIEAVLTSSTASLAAPSVTGSSIKAQAINATVQITGSPSGISTVTFGSTVVIVADKETATTFWNPHLTNPSSPYDVSPDAASVLIVGPYLVRNATISGSTLKVFGDINATTAISFLAPKAVTHLTWNGRQVTLKDSNIIGMKTGSVAFSLSKPSLPNLKSARWSCVDSLPEIQGNFDDSSWVNASKTSTPRPDQPFAGKVWS
jgi:hypothetical protein